LCATVDAHLLEVDAGAPDASAGAATLRRATA